MARDRFDSAFHMDGTSGVELRAIVSAAQQTIRFGVSGPHWLVVDRGPNATWTRRASFGWTGYNRASDVAGLHSTNR